MDSDEMDTDSGGSHISATPPRSSKPPSPPPFSLPKSTQPSLRSKPYSLKTTSQSKPTRMTVTKMAGASSHSETSKADSKPAQLDPLPNQQVPFSLSHLPFSIRRPNEIVTQTTPAGNSIEHLPAGHFSKSARFSKMPNRLLNLECTETEPVAKRGSDSQIEVENRPDELGNGVERSGKAVRKHLNMIGGRVQILPAKQRKCSAEGNFVRLNINGYGHKRKFVKKGRKSQFKSGGRRYGKRDKSKLKAQGEAEEEELCDEDCSVTETRKDLEKGKSEFDNKLVDEAVLACKDEASDENLARLLNLVYGYDSFRNGQLEAIKMVLSGRSTMVVLPTGAGKSLIYQLAAMILPGITVVVSPLVALMIDQLKHLPPMIRGGILSSGQTAEEVSETLCILRDGNLKVLFVSPERFLNAEFLSVLSAGLVVSLLVVDEAHCLSEWSHNFRPSYMRLRAPLLHAKLNIGCVLAMTATATEKTLHAVMNALSIPPNNLIQAGQIRDNLQLSVSSSTNRMKDLMMLIKSSPFTQVRSIIIYCKFQFDADMINKYLCDNNISAKSYHSGIPAKDRRRTQELFCSNKIRVVVATVAFGLGLDKKDIGAVIHYSLPESLEEYVQEIGRAGRDGRLSYCHLLFDDMTYFKLRSLMYSDGVDEYALNKFLSHVFGKGEDSPGGIDSLVKEPASRQFDMKEEVMHTILTQLELGEVQYLELLPHINVTCNLNFHLTSPGVLAQRDNVVAAILKKSEARQGQHIFDIPSVANSIRITATDLSNHLKSLKLKGEITYELKDSAYCYMIVNVPEDFCSLAARLTKWLSEVESCKVRRLDSMFHTAVSAVQGCEKLHGCQDSQHTWCLQRKILDYFSGDSNIDVPNRMANSSRFLLADIKVFLQSNAQAKFTPRAVARIMHGIPSPAYPSATWSKTHFWGRYTNVDFQVVMEAARAELMNFVGKNVL